MIATSVEDYLTQLPGDRQEPLACLRKTIKENLPQGFEETMNYGMIGYVVPHSIFPQGYHCDSRQPLPFINLASQKNYIAFYHLGIYTNKDLLNWFIQEYSTHSKNKLDIGKSCIRFKKPDQIPYELLGKLCRKITPEDYIKMYLQVLKR